MVVYCEAQNDIVKVWGKQRPNTSKQYRLMKYVLRVGGEHTPALHNVVTGELVVLSQPEASVLENLPLQYTDSMKELVERHFLVPVDYDEFRQVINLRKILRAFEKSNSHYTGIVQYTILPTTGCNARCYYCFEEGIKTVTMTEETADKVVDYIVKNCGEKKKVKLSWFGGEPTVARDRINQICVGLKKAGIDFSSNIRTNGFLFDESMIKDASDIWNLKLAHITVDGIGEKYKKIKNYKVACADPYSHVMANASKLLERGIRVTVRMNYDLINYTDFPLLVNDLKERFGNNDLLHVYAQQISGEREDFTGLINHGSDEWFEQKSFEFNELLIRNGFKSSESSTIPHLLWHGCAAESDNYTIITPEGKLARCMESFGEGNCIGSIDQGIVNSEAYNLWKVLSDLEWCKDCAFYPLCPTVDKCPSCRNCVLHGRNRVIESMLNTLIDKKKEE